MDNCCSTSTESKRLQKYLLHMNSVMFKTTNSVYKMHEHSVFCLLLLHFLRITKSDVRIVKLKSRTSVSVWTHRSDASPSCSNFCNSTDMKVRYYFQLIFALCQRSHKCGECSLESKGTPLVERMLILSKMYRGVTCTQLKSTAVLQTKVLPETWFDLQVTETTKLAAINCSYKYTARIWKIQNFREYCVSTAGTRFLSDTLHVKKEVKCLEKSLASIVFHLNLTKKLGILSLISAHQIFTERGRWVSWSWNITNQN